MGSSDLTQNVENREVVSDRSYDLPSSYDDNKIVLMVRDPWTIFSYWETRKDVEDRVRNEIAERGLEAEKSVLRVYDMTIDKGDLESQIAFSFELRGWVDKWYVNTGASGKKWMVDIGILCTNGEFFCLARSNMVETPRYGMSDVYDEEWMCPEDLYYKMFAIAGGYGVGTSSMEIRELLERHMKEWISSGGISSSMFGGASSFIGRK
jgi:hypothetical protein